MYGLNRYTGPGCYRFLDNYKKVIYIGSAKNIDRRLSSHFKGKGSHLKPDVYKSTAKVEVCKTQDYATALALEQYLINEYKPKYNVRDKEHNINSKVVSNEDYYKEIEKWKLYIEFRPFSEDKNFKVSKFNMSVALFYLVIIAIVGYYINK